MQKRLISVGNGLALFIDKPIQKLLGLDVHTIVNLETDGVRLVIEAAGRREKHEQVKTTIEPWQTVDHVAWCGASSDEDARVAYFARSTFRALEELGITDAVLRRVYRGRFSSLFVHVPDCVEVYRTYVGRRSPATWDSDFRSMHRLEALLEAKQRALTWDDAIDAALLAVPFEEEDRRMDRQPSTPRPEREAHNTLLPGA